MKKLLKKLKPKKYEYNYLIPYLLLLVFVQFFRTGARTFALGVLSILSIVALCDICISKDRDNAIANWLLFHIVAGCVLTWCLFSAHELLWAVVCILIVCMILAVLVWHWKRAFSPKPDEPPQSEP